VVSKVRAEMVATAAEMAVAEVVATEMAEVVATEVAAKSSESIGRERHAAERENCDQCNE
jgi:hypothetical protein